MIILYYLSGIAGIEEDIMKCFFSLQSCNLFFPIYFRVLKQYCNIDVLLRQKIFSEN